MEKEVKDFKEFSSLAECLAYFLARINELETRIEALEKKKES